MGDSFADTRRELYELMQRMRQGRITPPTPQGVTPAEARAMMTLSGLEEHGEAVRPGRVAEMSHTTPSALSQTFKALEEKGLIERRRAGDDYRAVTVSLTEEGRRFAAEGRRLHDEHMEQVMSFLGEEDMAHFVRILKRIVEFHDRTHGGDRTAIFPRGDGEAAGCGCSPAAECAPAPAAGGGAPASGELPAAPAPSAVPQAPEGGDVPCA